MRAVMQKQHDAVDEASVIEATRELNEWHHSMDSSLA